MTMSAILFAAQAGIVRYLAADFHFIEISFFRALFGIIIMLPWLMRVGFGVLKTKNTKLYVARGFLGTLAMYGYFGGISLIPLADATAISFTFPLFIALGGVLLLKEKAHTARWISLFVGFAGTLIVIRPGFQEINAGFIMVIGAGVLVALSAMFLKIALSNDLPDTAALYQTFYMLPFSLVGIFLVWNWPSWEQWIWAFALGAVSTTAQRLYSRAFTTGDVGSVIPFDFTRLPFVVAIGFVYFSELPDLFTILGGTIIFCASIFA
ncbi:DMT family transporter, partial [Alphaproteobacteria bacterium]|nr:DMT family transporter [Alphaproteobacteria bacterium]